MNLIKSLVVKKKCRKGKAFAINSNGAYWLAIPAIKINNS